LNESQPTVSQSEVLRRYDESGEDLFTS